MGKFRLGAEEIKYMTLFETLTGAMVKDCVRVQNAMGFLVNKGDMGLAIGKNGSNIERVRQVIGKSIFVMEFSDSVKEFIRNLFRPIKVRRIRIYELNNERIVDVDIDKKDRRRVIGQEGIRIKIAKELSKRHYNIDNIKIKAV
ncbi:MAG TPA: NusA-like transcription termination signal-binding factor [Candidatus Altiarchaeales archaeon]|nr:NusA-like transcription termination signal-binding factor [Candidatus Altiarchaeales archaeon]